VISSSQRPLPTQHTTNTRHEYPCHQRDSNPRSQQSSGRYDHTYRSARRVMNTALDSGKLPVAHTGTACLAEWGLVSKPYHQLPLRLFRRCSSVYCQQKNGCFKWHYFLNNNRVWVHRLFKKKE